MVVEPDWVFDHVPTAVRVNDTVAVYEEVGEALDVVEALCDSEPDVV